MSRSPSFATALLIAAVIPFGAAADERVAPLVDVLNLDATVSTEVAPDLAVVTLAIVREGVEVAPLTKDVNETLGRAFADAKSVPGVVAANGGYSTFPRYDSRGAQNTRTGWQVRAEMVLKSRDFTALGTLVGKLSQSLQISGSSFEISPELQRQESSALIERGAHVFQDKALATARALGYSGYSIREITVGNADQRGGLRAMTMNDFSAMSAKAAAPMPVESGRVTLSLTVAGSLQMRK